MTETDETTIHPILAVPARRRFFKASGVAVLGGLAFAACGDDEDDEATTDTEPDDTEPDDTEPDDTEPEEPAEGLDPILAAQTAAGLEVLAVNTYQAGIDAAPDLGAPEAVAEFATTAMAQHQEALDTWNGILEGAGEMPVSEPPAELDAMVTQAFGEVTDVAGLAELALLLEQTAADTYLNAVEMLTDADAITAAAGFQYVDQQHAAVLLFVLGMYPVPDDFQGTDNTAIG